MGAKRVFAALVMWLAGAVAVADAQPETIITDRPDITESSRVVGPGRVQIETSALWQTFERGAVNEETLATPTLIRIGLGEILELRVGSGAYSRTKVSIPGSGESEAAGYSPLVLGGKLHFYENDAGSRSAGLLVSVEIPSGSSDFKTDDTAAAVVVALDAGLGDRVGVAANVGFHAFDDDAGDKLVGGVLTAAVGYGLTDALSGFVEFAAAGLGLASRWQVPVLDAGAAYLVTPDFQLDAAVGAGLNDKTGPDFFFTFGLSFRAAFLK